MTSLLPMLGSLALVGLAFLIHSLVHLVVIGGMVLAVVGGGLAASISQRRSRAKRWTRTRQRYEVSLVATAAPPAPTTTPKPRKPVKRKSHS